MNRSKEYLMKGAVKKNKDILGISNTEFRGSLILFILIIIGISVPYITDHFTTSTFYTSDEDKVLLDSLLEKILTKNEAPQSIKYTPASMKPFDPNKISSERLTKMGVKKWLADRIVKYRNSGGFFKTKESLLKIYGLDSTTYFRLEPYIVIDQPPKKSNYNSKHIQNRTIKRVTTEAPLRVTAAIDLNTADTTQLKTIKGIGSTLSARIIKYRNLLGGYISYDQLYEVYNLDSTEINLIKNYFTIPENHTPPSININTVSEFNLARHPYISKKQAKLLIAYRDQHGVFSTTSALKKVHQVDEDFPNKISPYLSFK